MHTCHCTALAPSSTLSNPTCRPSITFPLHSMISVNLTPSSELAQLSLQQTIEALRKINNSAKADRPDNDALANQLVSEHWQPWPTLVFAKADCYTIHIPPSMQMQRQNDLVLAREAEQQATVVWPCSVPIAVYP